MQPNTCLPQTTAVPGITRSWEPVTFPYSGRLLHYAGGDQSVFRGMDDVLWLMLILWDVSSRKQLGATLALLGGIFQGQNKNGRQKFQGNKYDFSTNEARNKCNTSFSFDFDWAIHFLYYFYDTGSFSRSKCQFQGQISKNTSFNN